VQFGVMWCGVGHGFVFVPAHSTSPPTAFCHKFAYPIPSYA
jgi:hypothetical protein